MKIELEKNPAEIAFAEAHGVLMDLDKRLHGLSSCMKSRQVDRAIRAIRTLSVVLKEAQSDLRK